jgi:hypothetical protein
MARFEAHRMLASCVYGMLMVFLRCCHSLALEKDYVYRVAYVGSWFYPSGIEAPWGANSQYATQLAIEDVNARKLCGTGCKVALPAALIFQANGTVSEQLRLFVRSAIDSGVVAIIGADWGQIIQLG